MIIANRLKNESRAEYLLYMWQVEDIIRLYDCNIDRISDEYLSRFQLDENTMAEMREWYGNLCEMMRSEAKKESGQIISSILNYIALTRKLMSFYGIEYRQEINGEDKTPIVSAEVTGWGAR